MELLIMRHGEAVPPRVVPDGSRWLTGAGRETARHVGMHLAESDVEVAAIVSSPRVRAVQTAELVAAQLGYHGEIQILDELCPDASVGACVDALGAFGTPFLAVSHQPLVSALTAALTGQRVGYSTGQVVRVAGGAVSWVYP